MNKTFCFGLLVILVVVGGLLPARVCAADDTGKYTFYYQRIEKVVQVEPVEEPQTTWGKIGRLFTKGVNLVKKAWDKVIQRNIAPGEGTKLWYSGKDSKIAYQMNRVKVQSDKQLLELMGAKNGDESTLNDGQKALLKLYRESKSQALTDLTKKSLVPRIVVHLTDTTGFEDSSEFPNVTSDFWPQSAYFSITMPSKRYAYAGSEEDAMSTFVHETGHCTNLTLPEIIKPYGPDGVHYAGEMIKERMAFQETWSDYQEALFSPSEREYYEQCAKHIQIEDPKVAGKYTYYDSTDPSIKGLDLLRVEAVNATILYRMSQEIPDGQKKVFKAFFDNNVPWRNMSGMLKGFAKLYPQDAAAMAKIVDQLTVNKLSDQEIQTLAGNSAEVHAYLTTRNITKEAPTTTTTTTTTTAQTTSATKTSTSTFAADSASSAAIAVSPAAGQKTPTAGKVEPQKQNDFLSAYRAFVEAAKAGNGPLLKKAKEQMDKARAKLQQIR